MRSSKKIGGSVGKQSRRFSRDVLLCLVVALAGLGLVAQPAAANEGWFWCSLHNAANGEARSFYSKVFRGNLEYKSNYERAFGAVVAARILKQRITGEVVCAMEDQPGEAKRIQNEAALDYYLVHGGTMEFIDWAY